MNKSFIFALLSLLYLSGCANVMEKKLDAIRNDYSNGIYLKSDSKTKSNTLNAILSGDGEFQAGNYKESDTFFEAVNSKLADNGPSLMAEIISATSNNMNNQYKPAAMDSLFVSYYQIWDSLILGRCV